MRSLLLLALAASAAASAQAQSGSNSTSLGTRTVRAPLRAGRALSTVTPLWAQNGLGPVELDRSNGAAAAGDGAPLTLNGQVFTSGLGCYSTSVIAYDLDRRAYAFTSWVGVDDSAGAGGSVQFEVVADGTGSYIEALRLINEKIATSQSST